VVPCLPLILDKTLFYINANNRNDDNDDDDDDDDDLK